MENNLSKRLAFEQAYGTVGDCPITRYEFRLDRDGLHKSNGISNTEELAVRLGGLVEYLTTKWYRETVPSDVRADRREVTELWQQIAEKAVEGVNGVFVPRTLPERTSGDVPQLVQQITGCMTSALAALGEVYDEPAEAIEKLWEYVGPELIERRERAIEKVASYRAKIKERQSKHRLRLADLVERLRPAAEQQAAYGDCPF